jgi:GNAT superfamily N-acetyltransferase
VNELEIRPVVRGDFPAWKPLWDAYNVFYGRVGETALPAEVTQTTWSRFFDAYEPMHAMVAQRADKLLGLVHFLFHRSTNQIAPVCYLQDLFTVEDARGKGIGRALIDAVCPSCGERRSAPRLLADPRNQRRCETTLRQGRRKVGFHRLSKIALIDAATSAVPRQTPNNRRSTWEASRRE